MKLFILGFIALTAFTLPQKRKTKIWLIGDSTIANKQIKAYPETGWGMPFKYFFDSTIEVDNRAKNGRSTKSFLMEGLWNPVLEQMQEGDFVFIQFGHNDEVETKKTYTTKEEFTANLGKYISETRAKKAFPVLITPVARRKFDSSGQIQGTHDVYSALVRNVAAQYQVPLIDLDILSQKLLADMGPENSKWLFNYLEPGEHPNYPDGKKDDTHFSELGARKMALIVLGEIKRLIPGLANHIAKPVTKK